MTDQSGPGDEQRFPRAPLHDSTTSPGASRARRLKQGLEHPENDLSDDADYANLMRPEPDSVDAFANQEDPLVIAERNRRSTTQAIRYLVVAVAMTFVFGFALLMVMRAVAGPEACAAVDGRFLCTENLQKTWAIIASLPPIGFLIGSMVIMVRKLRSYVRWRPWMGIFWVLVPFTMWILTITVQVYLAEGPAL